LTLLSQLLTWVFAGKVVLFSLCSRLYLRHVRVAYGLIADAMAVACFACIAVLGPILHLLRVDDLQYVAINVAVLVALCIARGVALPVRLTPEGIEEVRTLHREGKLSHSATERLAAMQQTGMEELQ
jgi:hypothetical protein